MDAVTTVADLRQAVQDFIARRKWEQSHISKNLAMSIATEAAELMEHLQWCAIDEGQQRLPDAAVWAEVADELADILISCLSFAKEANLDISSAVRAKLVRNEQWFPVNPAATP